MKVWPDRRILDLLGIELPIILAPIVDSVISAELSPREQRGRTTQSEIRTGRFQRLYESLVWFVCRSL